ncbi:MAG: DUF433 domain-containing protein [Acidobacteria bacterium]|nr:DUF433 domain-containing protein [Acidobacteriota bacterium]
METTQTVPLTHWEDGSIRITGSRVPLCSVIYHFHLGSTPEQITCKFQGLHPADIYAVIAYYLNNREAIDQYLGDLEAEADARLQQLESDPNYQRERREFRDRLMARCAALQREKNPSSPK